MCVPVVQLYTDNRNRLDTAPGEPLKWNWDAISFVPARAAPVSGDVVERDWLEYWVHTRDWLYIVAFTRGGGKQTFEIPVI